MNSRAIVFLMVFFSLCASIAADQILNDSRLSYSVYLPDNWVRDSVAPDRHIFYDSTGTYGAQLALVRSTYSTTAFPHAVDFTRANFIAYKLSVQYSVDPFGAVLYYDTSSTILQGSLRAMEAFSVFFSTDTTIGCWSEYLRYTSTAGYGYEIYAIGDTADMFTNIGIYAAILQSVVVEGNATSIKRYTMNPAIREFHSSPNSFNLLGRRKSDHAKGGLSGHVPYYNRTGMVNPKNLNLF